MFKYIALALLVATTDATKLYSRHRIAKPQAKNFLVQLMEPSAEEIMDQIDTDHDGHISEEEFVDWVHAMAAEHGAPPLDEE